MSSVTCSEQAALEPLDPRVARSRAAVLSAAAGMLIELGASSVTIEGIAERSGVAKTTIYRHWKSRSQLILDAFASLLTPGVQAPHTGPVRQQLESVLMQLVRGLTTSQWAPAVAALVDAADRDPELRQLLHDFLSGRKEHIRSTLRAAVVRGELRPDLAIEEAISALFGPVYYRRLVSREPLDERFIEAIVDQFLRGAEIAS